MNRVMLSLGVWLSLVSSAWGEANRPNIVLIFADDLGWKDVGYNGSDYYETPNIDRLKSQGMVFPHAYVGGANCQPCRACLLSGQYTPRHEVYAVDSTDRGPAALMRLIPIPNRNYLLPEAITIAESLKNAGYVTGHFGKWHLGNNKHKGTTPPEQGFDVSVELRGHDPAQDPKGMFFLTRAAQEFIQKNREKPFFAYVSHHAIHTPLEARQSTLEKFQAKSKGQQHTDATYAACLYDFDSAVGQLLQTLADLGLEKNTLVIFTSDNGGVPLSSQEPLRGNKGAYYEGGIRVPFVVRWPGVVTPGSECRLPISLVDLYPTFLDLAGAAPPMGYPLDGESLLPLFKGGQSLKRPALFWHFPGYLDRPVNRGRDPVFRTRPVSVIRKGDWKLFLYHEEWQLDGGRKNLPDNKAVELYNLAEDEGERRNLAAENSAKREELLDDLLAWFQAIGAKLPSERNPAYDPQAKPPPKKKAKD